MNDLNGRTAAFSQKELAFFAQDQWFLSPNGVYTVPRTLQFAGRGDF